MAEGGDIDDGSPPVAGSGTITLNYVAFIQRLDEFAERYCRKKPTLAMIGELFWVMGLDDFEFKLVPREEVAALAPPPQAQDPDLGKIERGHVCTHGIRWPHPCEPCDEAAWALTQAQAQEKGEVGR